ncbi:ribosomal protein S18-alanine N-acetyltransferase [Oscillochloris sp. ZM17-4]|uniref:ribosomal protein S18-alanine N-acetyltransferase n=1 Tax=Oscillochloris sp. ZM17-4 TaxID=2866714 RepID=UPI001C735B45|nr:ribosomal protein S18-alanine N-acetyltransferase [Oscillochloris sp. ZM17-4]MBX0327277.1 ribosomal protein S18-alanine N-acetyltransferase [Oscillochloris sp. ZM17-4]
MYYFIEPMTEDDIPEVQQIESQSFTTPWSANTYKREIRNAASCRYLVARGSTTPPPPRAGGGGSPRRLGIIGQIAAALFPSAPGAAPSCPAIGYGGLWLTVDDAHVTTIAVDPQYRGFGVGELLLNGLIDAAYELRAKMLTLEVRVSNASAQRLYIKYGFQPAGTRPRYYTDNGEDALIMWTEAIDTPEYQARLSELRRLLYARLQRQVADKRPAVRVS